MHHVFKRTCALMAIVALAFAFSRCSDDDPAVNTGAVALQNNSSLGNFLVDGKGMTLYFYTPDVNGQSNCSGGCVDAWPIYYADNIQPGNGVSAADFATITRADGKKQTTYKNWPLYYYVGDAKAGDVTGEAKDHVWFVAKPDYTLMLTDAQLVGHDGKHYLSNYQEGDGMTQFFVDSKGLTLYTFTKDFKDTNKFTASDLSNNNVWPIYDANTNNGSLPSTLNKSDFGSIQVAGRTQTTYKGWPLYYFGQDSKPGDTKGVSFPAAGIWHIVNTSTAAAPVQPTVMTRNDATLGKILTDNQGRTLYFFARDTKGASNCTGGCLTRWPAFNVAQVVVAENSGLSAADFGTIGGGATEQVTYKGRPLYYYSDHNDGVIEAAGQTQGDKFGTLWYVAAPDYSMMIASGQMVGSDNVNYIIDGNQDYVAGDGNTRYFTDGAGRTIYIFKNDASGTNTFTNDDPAHNAIWPVYYFEMDDAHLPSAFDKSDFGEIEVHGMDQLTYKGWPLYYFSGDANKGDTKGITIGGIGTKWPVVTIDTEDAPLP